MPTVVKKETLVKKTSIDRHRGRKRSSRPTVVKKETVVKKTSSIHKGRRRRRSRHRVAVPRFISPWAAGMNHGHLRMKMPRFNHSLFRKHSRMRKGGALTGFTKVVDSKEKGKNTKGETVTVRRRVVYKKKK